MRKSFVYLTFVSFFLLAACSKKKNWDRFHFYQDFESLSGWTQNAFITSEYGAHSGIYSAYTNVDYPYSQVFSIPFKRISKNPITRVRIAVWVNLKSSKSDASLFSDVLDTSRNLVQTSYIVLSDAVTEKDKWTRVYLNVSILSSNCALENTINVFLKNNGSGICLADDYEIVAVE